MKKMALLLAALLLLSSLAGCGKSSKGEASVESVSMICGLNGVGPVSYTHLTLPTTSRV